MAPKVTTPAVLAPNSATASPSVLIADDDTVSLATLSRGLRAAGFTTLEATSMSMALQLCQPAPPSLAILDYDMPCASGIEFADALRGLGQFPIFLLSARTDESTVRAAVNAGATAYFVKPMDPIRLVPTIRTALQRFSELQVLRCESEQLATALKASRNTSVVVGVLMERLRLPEAEAYDRLRHYARSHARKVADVASEILSATGLLNEAIMQIGSGPIKRGHAVNNGLQKR